ncbi:MAG: alcohol dehydrogenase catalytic domain-containing protein [Chloroflexota bacterium]|nr:alcohol dehydrogenase catalytic domain-containing protein [Chloroflexota bacterium]
MTDKLNEFKTAETPLAQKNQVWPLYGAGLENLGDHDQVIEVPMPRHGPDELLVRHDATGLCFSDIKVIRLGEEHPRIYRDMASDPVVLGHEIAMTVVGVGENLADEYEIGDRFTIQADIFVDGVGYAYGYEIQGGLSEYTVIDQRILNGDEGNYLLPVKDTTGYAESALTEPWACVTAAYGLTYRTSIKPDGVLWIIGSHANPQHTYSLSAGFEQWSHPTRVLLTNVPDYLAEWVKARAEELDVTVTEVSDLSDPPVAQVDDIILLGGDAELIETVSPHLADFGTVALVMDRALDRPVNVDIGRVHYNRWLYVGGKDPDIASAYSDMPVRSSLRPGGRAWFVGAGGPMGRMHVQRAIQVDGGPGVILCTDVSDVRLADLEESFRGEAEEMGIEFICLNPMEKEAYAEGIAPFKEQGFDDIVVMAPVPFVISDAANYLADEGVMNIFAGVARGTEASLELSDIFMRDVRIIGHSASSIDDLRLMLDQAESGVLSPNRSVAAIGSLSAAKDGLQAVKDQVFPGKVVIYPQIKEFPLTPVPELKDKLPSVYAALKDGRIWTVEAEEEFLRQMLP